MSLSRDAAVAAQRHAIVTVQGLSVVFASMAGGDVTADYELPGENAAEPEVTVGQVRTSPIVLTTPVSPFRDLEWIRQAKTLVGKRTFTITRQWTDANWTPVGAPETYPGCLLVEVANPESSPATEDVVVSLTFVPTGEA